MKVEKRNEHELAQWVFYHIKGRGNLSPCFQRFDVETKDISSKKPKTACLKSANS